MGRAASILRVKMEAAHHNPEDHDSNVHHHENPKTR